MPTDASALVGSWVRSNEEEAGAEVVYRPVGHELPPARGRESFELRPGGELVERGPGPVDVPVESTGAWELAGDELVLRSAAGERRFAVVSASEDRLVLRA